ncbi:MAG: hypothetical protein FWF80_08675, partial [Defluviitaleaceae bacterium]|nr:hypothetical protein [Defluviitaleaceae bacterium]
MMKQNYQTEELYRVVKKEGTHLAPSKNTTGAVRGSLLDGNNQLAGQAEFIKVEREDDYPPQHDDYPLPENKSFKEQMADELIKSVGETLREVIPLLIDAATPHIKNWWTNTATPYVKAVWNGFTGKKTKA